MEPGDWKKAAGDYEGEVLSVFDNDRKGKIKALIKRFGKKQGQATDLGCGVGKFLPLLAEHFGKVQKAELTTTSDSYNVTIIVDRSSLELFIDNGTTVMTALVFPKTVYETLHVAPNSQSIHQLSIDRLGSVWSSN